MSTSQISSKVKWGIAIISATLLFGLQSCKKGGTYSCDVRKGLYQCIEYTGSGYDKDSVKAGCELVEGKVLKGSCPSKNLIGKCTFKKGKKDEYVIYYYSGGIITKDSAKSTCKKLNGEFSPVK